MTALLLAASACYGQAAPSQPDASQPAASQPSPLAESSTTQPAGDDSPSGAVAASSVSSHSPRVLLRSFYDDQKAMWTSPLHMRLDDVTWALPLAGLTAGAFATDADFSRHLSNDPTRLKHARDLSDAGTIGLGAVGAGLYVLGALTHDDHKRESGWLMGEGLANTFALVSLGKVAFGRERPFQASGQGSFGQGGSSFPSDHAALAWSAASVLAHEYPGPLMQFLAYGTAGAVSASRVISKDHFASDAILGSALGWFVGREVYRLHHDEENGGPSSGEFVREGEGQREPRNMGSPYVPLDSWTYAAFDRLAAEGYVQSGIAGMRPWTRLECARLVAEAQDRIDDDDSDAARLVSALSKEFGPDLELLGGGHNMAASVDSLYVRWTGISGTPLRDSYHFGETITNDFGRPYGEGSNYVTGFSTHAEAGPLAVYVSGEYQHAPAGPEIPSAAREVVREVDQLPAGLLPPAVQFSAVNRLHLLDAYVALNVNNWQLSFGKQSLWWGPDQSGPMLLSNNAEPITMFRMNRVSPFRLPGPFKLMGPVRAEFFVGQLEGFHLMLGPSGLVGNFDQPLARQPMIHGEKLSFKPTPNFEFSVSRTTLFSGGPFPFTWGKFLDSLLATNNLVGGSANKPGDRRSALDLTYRLPKLRNWLTFYADGFTDDEFSPVAYWDRSAWTAGLYMPHLPKLPKLDLRAEGVYTDLPIGGAVGHGFFYFNGTWRNGYTNDGTLMGSWIGRDGQGAQTWLTYHLGPRSFVQGSFRHQEVSQQFIAQGGNLMDAAARADFMLGHDLDVSGGVQYERWNFPILATNQQRNVSTTIQLTWHPKASIRAKP